VLSIQVQKRNFNHCTVRLKVALWVVEPLLPVIVIVYAPAGVPLLGGGLVLLLPPPQAPPVSIATTITRPRTLSHRRREDTPPRRTAAKSPPVAANNVPRRCHEPGV